MFYVIRITTNGTKTRSFEAHDEKIARQIAERFAERDAMASYQIALESDDIRDLPTWKL